MVVARMELLRYELAVKTEREKQKLLCTGLPESGPSRRAGHSSPTLPASPWAHRRRLEMGPVGNWSWCCRGGGVACGTVSADFCLLLRRRCFVRLNGD